MNAQQIWNEYYLESTGVPFYFDAKEGATLKKLVSRITWYCEQKGYKDQTEEFYLERLKGFLDTITDKFVLERLVPSMVLQQFNILLAQAEGKKPKNKEQIYIPVPMDETKMDDIQYREWYKKLVKENHEKIRKGEPVNIAVTTGQKLRKSIRGDAKSVGAALQVRIDELKPKT